MSDLLHWCARAHGPRAFRLMLSARSGELDRDRAIAASRDRKETTPPAYDSAGDRQAAHWRCVTARNRKQRAGRWSEEDYERTGDQ